MVDLQQFEEILKKEGVEFISGVPDTLLNEFCLFVERSWPKERHIIAANEGNAVALASGYHLGTGTIPMIYMQNSGLGNTINPLLSLTNQDVYSIPMVIVVGWRGDPAVNDHPQHKLQGVLTPTLLEDMQVPYKILDQDNDKTLASTAWAINKAREINSPVALIAKKGVLEKGEKEDLSKAPCELELSREGAIKTILETLSSDTYYVATTGRATRELHEVRNLLGHDHASDFLNIGAMGHASSIAAGMAISQSHKPVVCLDGDAGALMHLGSLAVNANSGISNLMHIVLNNGVHESVGGQTSVGHDINFTQIARNAGYTTPDQPIKTKEGLIDALRKFEGTGPVFMDVHIRKGMRPDMPPLKIQPRELKESLMKSFGRG